MTNPNDNHLTIINPSDSALAHIGQVANHYAAQNVFADYLSRKADNTIRRQAEDLARFVEFLNQVGEQAGLQLGAALGAFARAVAAFPDGPDLHATAWHGVTWGPTTAGAIVSKHHVSAPTSAGRNRASQRVSRRYTPGFAAR